MNNAIWVVGSANFDTTYAVDHLPGRGETLVSENLFAAPGGKGLNQAVAAACAGAPVAFICAWGDDGPGSRMRQVLAEFGVDTSRVAVVSDIASGHALIYVDAKGDNCIVVHPGANNRIPLLDCAFIKPGDLLITQLEIPFSAASHYVRCARKAGAKTLLNPSPALDRAVELLPFVDILVMNETEASLLSGIQVASVDTALAAGRSIVKLGPALAIVTLGADGAVAVEKGEAFHLSGEKKGVVDTQGAGDVFLGVFAAALLAEGSLEKAVAMANHAAARSVTCSGSTCASLKQIGKPGFCETYDLARL